MLKGKTVLLGVTGGIAAYKAAALCSMLVKQHCNVHVIMTKNACEFITPLTFETLSGNRTVTDTFDRNHTFQVEHVALADQADLVVIAPATADVLAKLACGIADDMLTTTVLACDCPKIAVPAMNTKMYENPITQGNIETLRRYGWEVLEPASGRLACGTSGKGKMPEPEDILGSVLHSISRPKDMEGLNVLVTAGPTLEAIDPVRFISNHSTGKMGYAIARAAAARGACVTLVSGPVCIKAPAYVKTISVTSAKEMFDIVTSAGSGQDMIIKAAAVADFRPARYADEKIKKNDPDSSSVLELEKTDDILAWLGANKRPGQLLCGFSMETQNMIENSRKKLQKKNLDLIAANNLKQEGAGFGTETNVLTLISKESEKTLPLMSKDEAADRLLDELLGLRAGREKVI